MVLILVVLMILILILILILLLRTGSFSPESSSLASSVAFLVVAIVGLFCLFHQIKWFERKPKTNQEREKDRERERWVIVLFAGGEKKKVFQQKL